MASSTLTNRIQAVDCSEKQQRWKKYGLTEKLVLEKFEYKTLTRIESKPTYRDLQVWNEDIWRNVADIP